MNAAVVWLTTAYRAIVSIQMYILVFFWSVEYDSSFNKK